MKPRLKRFQVVDAVPLTNTSDTLWTSMRTCNHRPSTRLKRAPKRLKRHFQISWAPPASVPLPTLAPKRLEANLVKRKKRRNSWPPRRNRPPRDQTSRTRSSRLRRNSTSMLIPRSGKTTGKLARSTSLSSCRGSNAPSATLLTSMRRSSSTRKS